MENIQYSWVGGLNIVKMAVLQNLSTDLTQFLSKSYLPFFAGIDKLILKLSYGCEEPRIGKTMLKKE